MLLNKTFEGKISLEQTFLSSLQKLLNQILVFSSRLSNSMITHSTKMNRNPLRINRTLETNNQICPYHRYSQSKTCNHPQHTAESVKKAPPVRSVLIYLTKLISNRYNTSFPIGSVLCKTHLKEERKNKTFLKMKTRTLH